MKSAAWTDPIVVETRKWREELLNESGNDLGRLVQHLMEIQVRHGERLVSFEPGKNLNPSGTTIMRAKHEKMSTKDVSAPPPHAIRFER